jgi:hypothetical protein
MLSPLWFRLCRLRVWGIIVDYKPMRQRRWSRALVRHGAEAREAIAAVLGVAAEDLVTRDRADH